jgi:pyridoxine 4-dehydrogenase
MASLPTCRELGVGVTAYSVVSRGLISRHFRKARPGKVISAPTDCDSKAKMATRMALVEALRAIIAQIAIAWVLAQGADIVPLIGARRRDRLDEAPGALDVALTAEDLEAIGKAVPKGAAAGELYRAAQMPILDSEAGEGA